MYNWFTAVVVHIHWNHIGGHKYFSDFYVHADELERLNGKLPLSIKTIKEMVADCCSLPEGFCVNDYKIFGVCQQKCWLTMISLILEIKKLNCCILSDILWGICAFWKKAGDIFLQAIWFIKIFCLLIIRLLIWRNILIFWKKLWHYLLRKYLRHIIHWIYSRKISSWQWSI